MKKVICFLMTILMTISMCCIPASANEEVGVFLDGDLLEFDVQPQIINGRTMVPMRKIFESLGATVEWENSTQLIRAKRQDITVVMQINSPVMSVNGRNITLDVPPQLVNGRTLVPVRAVAESFDVNVVWDEIYNSVVLSTYIPFNTSAEAFDYLCSWLLENGTVFSEYVYVGWDVIDDVEVQIRCFPDAVDGRSCISLNLNTYAIDEKITTIYLWKTSDRTSVYASYISGDGESEIEGELNMEMHTDNYPLIYRECKLGEDDTAYGLTEDTRQRINLLLDEADMILSFSKTGVTLNTLGFKKR
jgi:hypothetical protein